MKKYDLLCKDFPHFLHGGDYNPDQWLAYPDILQADMQLMQAANCNEMTVGIFAWAALEPSEGSFDFAWLDAVLDRVYAAGGRVILATPSGARPRWMAQKYPQVLRVLENGARIDFSTRHNHCYTSPVYREKVRIINEQLARRYGSHPAVVAWHLSNEYNGACYCPLCRKAFQDWLRVKYENDLAKLNDAWWAGFWSHQVTDFDQIDPPRDSVYGGDTHLSCQLLDWKRFVSHQTVEFARLERDALKKYSDRPVTTNCMNTFAGYDHYAMADILDFYSNDSYPQWRDDPAPAARYIAFQSALCRGMKNGRPFMVMESAPGINMARLSYRRLKSTEEQLLEAMLHVANGADAVQYFQFRKGRGGSEKYHGAVVDHDGSGDTRVFAAVRQTGARLQKLDGVLGTGIAADVAILHDYPTRWALSPKPGILWEEAREYVATMRGYFDGFWNKNIAADVVRYDTDLAKYRLVCLTQPYIMTPAFAQKLRDYVAAGGTLVTTPLTAANDENDRAYLGGVPGAGLAELFGLTVEEVDAPAEGGSVNMVSYNGGSYPVNALAEVIRPAGAAPVAVYENRFYAGSGAVYCNAYGLGRAYYIGFTPGTDFMNAFLADLAARLGLAPTSGICAEEGVSITCRRGDGEEYFFVLNCTAQKKTIRPDAAYTDLLTSAQVTDQTTLKPYETLVLVKK